MATASNQLTVPYSSSSSSSSTTNWDVFLSFFGKDTRRKFTSHLYSALVQVGILTYMDDPELEKGEEISSGLLNAIRASKIFVVLLSENYAYSSWCLDELVEILAYKRTSGRVVIPVFYYVDPSELRHLKGSFGDAIDVQKKRYSVDIIEKWKSALNEIAELSGYHLKIDADENESYIIQKILDNVTPLISTKDLHLEEYLVGIDSSVEEIYKKSPGGTYLLPLLQQLSVKLLGRTNYKVTDLKNGIRQLKQFLCTKKALIVVDDLDQSSYSDVLVRACNLVSAGSRIIFTTRDANLVNKLKQDISEVDIYMMRELKQVDSLELFSYHAFRKPTPPESFAELTLSFVTYTGGPPLALKVLGSSLLGRTDASFWKDKLVKVQKIAEKDIQKILQLSYDDLDDETQKAIFLDIAFFFVGKDKDEAVPIFESCGFFPVVGIPVLVERCLLTVDEKNRFQMHNLIQDMGKEVIREEFEHGNRTRLYLCQPDACVALQNLEGIQKIEGLIIDQTMSTKRHFSAEILERMPSLRLLEIIGALDIKGNFKNSFHELRCLRWHRCPWMHLPSCFRPQKLVSLDMPYSELKTLWKGVTPLVNLKTMNLSYSRNLKIMSDFSNLTLVDKLLFRGSESLREVHPSIGQLSSLSYLDLGECSHLKELTESIGQLSKLGHLDLERCVNLKRLPQAIKQLINIRSLNLRFCRILTQLPEQLGDMKCLKILDASYTSIEQLPDSITHLKELVDLKLNNCKKLRKLPEQLGDMKCLKMLDASYTSIEQLPDSIAHLKELVDLKLCECNKLRKLPEQIGNMESLKLFDASYSAIEHLPDSFAGMFNLVELNLRWCKNLTSLPNSLWKLKVLRVLRLSDCLKLEQLPEQLGKMQCLEELHASHTAIEELPDSIGLLSRLEVLDLEYCYKVRNLPSSIGNLTSLTRLCLDQEAMDTINLPDMVKDMKLTSLELSCNVSLWLPVIQSFSSLVDLELWYESHIFSSNELYSLSKLSNLQDIRLHNCTSRDFSISEFPANLITLSINYATVEMLPELSSLKQLKLLYIQSGVRLQTIPPLTPHLEVLILYECTSLQYLPDLSMLKDLEQLDFKHCINLDSISLKQSFLQVGQYNLDTFEADIPNKEVAEWFSYKSSGNKLSFTISPNSGDYFFGFGLWIVYKCKYADGNPIRLEAVITNKTKDIIVKELLYLSSDIVVGEVQSKVQCIRYNRMKSGDRIKVSFKSSPYDDGRGEAKLKICGAHLIQNNLVE